ncbi:MAG: NnrU family protein [Gammaproteobacteria bacterium]
MTWLLGGIALFFGAHFIPALPALRARLAGKLGETGYKLAFAALSLAGLVCMVRGLRLAESITLWQPPQAAGAAAVAVMLPAFILLASVKFDNHIARATRHPMSWGLLLWAVCHFFANGELGALVFFGAFAAYLGFYLCARGRGAQDKPGKPSWRLDALAVVIGVIAYAVLGVFHHALFGEFPIPY